MTKVSTKSPTHVIQITVDDELYQSFQAARRQAKEVSNSSMGKKIITDYLFNQLNESGTQKHFNSTFQDHMQRSQWLSLFTIYLLVTITALLTQLTGKPQSPADILAESAKRFGPSYNKLNKQLIASFDATEKS